MERTSPQTGHWFREAPATRLSLRLFLRDCLDRYPLTARSLDKCFHINADQSDSMHAIVEQCFPKAMITIDRFHTHQPEYVDDRKKTGPFSHTLSNKITRKRPPEIYHLETELEKTRAKSLVFTSDFVEVYL